MIPKIGEVVYPWSESKYRRERDPSWWQVAIFDLSVDDYRKRRNGDVAIGCVVTKAWSFAKLMNIKQIKMNKSGTVVRCIYRMRT